MENEYFCPTCGVRARRTAIGLYSCPRGHGLFMAPLNRTERNRRFPTVAMKHPKAALWEAMGEPSH